MQESSSSTAIHIGETWKHALAQEFSQPYFQEIKRFLKAEKAAGKVIYPPGNEIFHAFDQTPLPDVKVVIIGQDPYHGPGQAHGLCFSVRKGVKPPPSLVNIFKELKADIGMDIPAHGCLDAWAAQGVFLLNAMLTVEKDKPASHHAIGWQSFTDAAIRAVSAHQAHVVFILWGAFAQQKANLIDAQKHLILRSPHPSPFSADKGFFGCKHFSKANTWLQQHEIEPVNWQLS